MSYFVRTYALVVLSLVAYILPWVVNPGSALSMGAFDLAEWASIHPLNRTATPTLLTTLLLRIPLVCMVFVLVLVSHTRQQFSSAWWIVVITTGVIVVAASPPLEFLTESRHDPNYRQQAILVITTIIGGVIGLIGKLRWRYAVGLLLLSLGLAVGSGWIGVLQAYDLMVELGLPSELGPGIYLFSLSAIMMIADVAMQQKRASKVYAYPPDHQAT